MRRAARRACRTVLAGALLLAGVGGAPVCAQSGVVPAADLLYLEVSVNGRPTGLIMQFSGASGSLRTSAANLRQLGMDAAAVGTDGELALDRITGLSYVLDMATQSLALRLDDAIRAPFKAYARVGAGPARASASPGAVLNYDAVLELGAQAATLLNGELRMFNESSSFTTSGSLVGGRERRRALRYDSYWQRADPDTLRVLQVGDLVTGALPWNRALRLGGVQWRKNFTLRPDLLTYPTATVNGSALVPSALSLYVNGVQQYTTEVPDGPFVLNQVAGISGAGEASVVTRDALGRATVTALPLYVDTRMLARGLWDYSFEAGAQRERFGQRSFDYGNALQGSASLRYGVTGALTLEGHAEAGAGLLTAGAGMLAALNGYGVLSAHAAASGGRGHGTQAGIGYQYLARRYSIDAQAERSSAGFADQASRAGAPVPRAVSRIALSAALGGQQNLSFSHIHYKPSGLPPAAISALSYGATLGRRVFLSLSAFTDARRQSNRGLFASLSFALGEHGSASAGGGRQNGMRQRQIQLQRTPDFGGGFGWSVQAAEAGNIRATQARVRYLGERGELGASAYANGSGQRMLLDASGALVAMDGALAPARQVGAGFALVSTGMPGVPVTHENRIIGKTDGGGHLLVPNLNPYSSNLVGIDVGALAADARVERSAMVVAPRSLAGVLVRLPVERYRAASVILRDAAGVLLAPGTPLRHVESATDTVVGHDGLAFIDRLAPINTLEAGEGEARCSVRFAYEASAAALPLIGPLTCAAGATP